MKKTVFLTGAAGFIGFHLARKLQERGDEVVGYDNFNAYYDPKLKRERAAHLAKVGIPVHCGDIADGKELNRCFTESGATHFVHLAAQAGVRHSLQVPQDYLHSNLQGFLQVLELLRKHPTIPLVFASSSSVYGKNGKIPFSVKDPTDQAVSFYGATKKANEVMAYSYHNLFGISMTGLRFFTVYGPWGRPDMAYWKFAEAIVEERPIDLFAPQTMQRDFTYIDDIVAGTLAAIDRPASFSLYNLGNHRPVSLLRFLEILEEHLGKKAITNVLPMPPGDVPVTYADIEESERDLGFAPKISLEEGLAHFLSWYTQYRNPSSNSR